MKVKLIIILSGVILALSLSMAILTKKIFKIKSDRDRISLNFENAKFKIDSSYNAKLNAYIYEVNSLEVKHKELKSINKELVEEARGLGVKVKNLNSIVETKMQYIVSLKKKSDVNKVGIVTTKISERVFEASYSDDFVEMLELISISGDGSNISVDSLYLSINADLKLFETINYKGWWFWRKATDISLKIVSDNPYLKIEKMEKYNLRNRNVK